MSRRIKLASPASPNTYRAPVTHSDRKYKLRFYHQSVQTLLIKIAD
jgi:hypothetical protein